MKSSRHQPENTLDGQSPTAYELASVAAVLSLRNNGEDDINHFLDQALQFLRAAKQKIVLDEAAEKKRSATEREDRRKRSNPSLIFDPAARTDEVREYLKSPTNVLGESLNNISKASTLERKLRAYCEDVEIIFEMKQEDRGKCVKAFFQKATANNPTRVIYSLPKIELDCFADWQREVMRIEALTRKGTPLSAFQIWTRLSSAAHGRESMSVKAFAEFYARKYSSLNVENKATTIISELHSIKNKKPEQTKI